jgi:5-methylcytosine-specific restriction endonuclease McrA
MLKPCQGCGKLIERLRNRSEPPLCPKCSNKRNYQRHREQRLIKQKDYYTQHKPESAWRMKQYAKDHRDELKIYHAVYRQSDMPGATRMRAKSAEYSAKSRDKNIEHYRERQRMHEQKRRAKSSTTVNLSLISYWDDGLCAICGLPLIEPIEVDHIIPLSRGGEHAEINMRRLHEHCNRAKRDRLDDEITHRITERCRVKTIAHLGHAHMI